MDQQQAKDLLSKYAAGQCTPEEKTWVESWYLQEPLDASAIDHNEILEAEAAVRALLPGTVYPLSEQPRGRIRRIWPRAAAAAVIILIVSAATIYLARPGRNAAAPPAQVEAATGHDVQPALNEATLTLANGQKITLSKLSQGEPLRQGNTSVAITADSVLAYSGATAPGGKMAYNTLSTVRGQRAPYPLLLADGSRAWLDAASSITFPVSFTGGSRQVTVTGQVYFEVKHDDSHPFRVVAGDQLIEDIGTRFNINAFDDEPAVITTLVEGSVRVSNGARHAVLAPGQMAASAPGKTGLQVKEADADEALSWKNGYFYFNHESLQSVLRKVSRWYNVSIEYPAGASISANYWGTMSREANLSVVLNRLEVTGDVHFALAGHKIIVSKK